MGWDLRTLRQAFSLPHPHAANDVTCVAAHPSRAAAAVGYGNGDVALFDVRGQGSLLHVMPLHTDQCRSVEFSPNGACVPPCLPANQNRFCVVNARVLLQVRGDGGVRLQRHYCRSCHAGTNKGTRRRVYSHALR